MKNIDKIKNMTTWELAEFIYDVSNNATQITTCENMCAECEFSDGYCISNIGEWLNEDVKGAEE